MRKFIISLFIFSIFVFHLFAKQPFFLQNWIIPDNFVWGSGKKIPAISGKTFYQMQSASGGNPYVTFYPKKNSNIDFPPYFTERNLLSWDMTYAEIIDAFKNNKEFFTDAYVYYLYNNDNVSAGVEFLDVIQIICREENHLNIEVYFPHTLSQEDRESSKPSYCYVYYNRKGLKESEMDVPDTEVFESLYRKMWNENTSEEKDIIVLTYFFARMFGFVPAQYDCSLLLGNQKLHAVARLKETYSIKNRDELLSYIQTPGKKNVYNYYDSLMEFEKLSQAIDDNQDKELMEIAKENNYSVTKISQMFCVDSMRKNLGSYGVSAYVDLDRLFVLRLGVGAGYISREESLEYGLPLADKLLKQYKSFYDFAAHTVACESYLGVGHSKFLEYAVSSMFYYNGADRYLPLDEISFDGSESAEPLIFDNAYYKPAGEAFWWTKIQKESEKLDGKELPALKYEISKYGELPCLMQVYKRIRPVEYDSGNGNYKDESAFFSDNYKALWDTLPDIEKYAIAFSSNLFELNKQYHLDFTGRVVRSKNSADPAGLLDKSWEITDGKSLIETFNSLEEYGHSGAFKSLSDLLDKYPGKSPLQIANDELLSVLDTTRLLYVEENRKILGSHGIEAWDQGREITILRWGVASGYISEEKAKELMEPVITKIRQNYNSWSDFMDHYIAGRGFYGLYNCSSTELMKASYRADASARAYIPLDSITFTGENADIQTKEKKSIGKSDLLKKWERVQKLYSENTDEKTLESLKALEKEYSAYPNIFVWWHTSLLFNDGDPETLVSYIDNHKSYFEGQKDNKEIYPPAMLVYIEALNSVSNPKRALQVYESLPEWMQNNVYFYYQYALANYLMLSLCDTQKEYNSYKATAKKAFQLLQENNYQLDEFWESWLEAVK